MTTSGEDLTKRAADEIRTLRKGRGLQVGDLDSRLGPLLGELAGVRIDPCRDGNCIS